jgi:hypothetical protein
LPLVVMTITVLSRSIPISPTNFLLATDILTPSH